MMKTRIPALGAALSFLVGASTLAGCQADAEDEVEAELEEVQDSFKAAGLTIEDYEIDRVHHRIVFTGTFPGADGNPNRFRLYEHIGRDDANVVFVHGRAEFLEKYDFLFTDVKEFPAGPLSGKRNETLADLPISFVALDLTGQGDSKEGAGRLPSHIDDYDTWVEDIRRLFNAVPKLKSQKGAPTILLGHSAGGLASVRFAQKYPELVDGMVMTSAFWGFNGTPENPAENIRGFGDFYTYTLGMPRLCTQAQEIPADALGTVLGCATGGLGAECQACFEDRANPDNCTDPAGQDALMKLAAISAVSDKGCNDFGFECPAQTLTTDDAFCEFINDHPFSGPGLTMGWLSASFAAQEAFGEGPEIGAPTLILSNLEDTIVSGEAQTCEKFSGACEVINVETVAHELLTSLEKPAALKPIRRFLRDIGR
jgi:alpha-beta hydrolase superfamily lysophospholipase